MSIIEVYLFELALLGDRLDEINAEAVLNRRATVQATVQAKAKARRLSFQRLTQHWSAWLTQLTLTFKPPSRTSVK